MYVFLGSALRRWLVRSLFIVAPVVSFAQTTVDTPTVLDRMVVHDRSTDLVGTAESASQGSVGYVQLDARPFLRRGELLEVIPGVVITQHSGGGKANQYFLRGFNLDHGTDFSVSVDGMPVNLRTHAHGQGYADLNFLIPELIQEVNYNKGPFFAEIGDFSAAGAAQFHLFKELPAGIASVTVGSDDFTRVVLANSIKSKFGVTTYGLETGYDNGPWDLAEHFRRFSGMLRQHWESGEQTFDLMALAYHAKWRSSDQVPLRAVQSGLIDRFGNIDPSDQGETDRESISFDYTATHGDAVTRANVYAIFYRLSLYSNFTYFLDNPNNGDQFNQRDRRTVIGGSIDHSWVGNKFDRKSETKIGLQVREDLIPEVALLRTSDRAVVSTVRNDDVKEGSIGLFARNQTRWTEWFRTEAGVRGDAYRFDVTSSQSLNSGQRTAAILSPKVSLAFGPWAQTEYYFNVGMGFHSNDARGTTLHLDPTSGVPADPASPLVRSKGVEAGLRTSVIRGLVSSVSLWALDLNSELVFSGDSGATEPAGATRRYGVEFANYYRANSWLAFDADLSLTRSRYRHDVEGGGRHIANSIGTVLSAGVVVDMPAGWFGSVRLRYFGPQPLIEDNSVLEPSSLTFNARVGYRYKQWEVSLDVLNVLNRKNDDIAYFYISRLPGDPAGGVDDIHFHPAEPRLVRVTLTRHF